MTQYLKDKRKQRREEKLRAEALLEEILKSVQNIERVVTDRGITVSVKNDFTSLPNPETIERIQTIRDAEIHNKNNIQ